MSKKEGNNNNTAFAKEGDPLSLSKGYKQTKLGWIPEEWSVLEFDEFAERSKTTYSSKNDSGNYKCIELEHINQNSGSINGWTDSISQKSTKVRFEKGQILFGKLRPYLRKYWISDFSGVCSTEIWVIDGKNDKSDNNFLFYLIQSHRFIQAANATSGSKMPRADWWYVSKFPFILPPFPEQQKIASILNTWDIAIAAQEKLIAQKQALKKGLMQELLTGKKRFAGFEEEWEQSSLGKIGDVKMCKRIFNSETNPDTGIPFYKIGTFGKKPDAFIDEELFNEYKRKYSYPKIGEILISASGTIGRTVVYNGELAYYQDSNIIWIENDEKLITNEFLLYVLKSARFETEGGTIKRLYSYILKETKILLPSLVEQRKMVNILNAANKETVSLQENLQELKKQKQGLMQQLLTGEKRVKIKLR